MKKKEATQNAGNCPVCSVPTFQNGTFVYCENCGFNIVDKRDNYSKKDEKTIGIEK